MNVLSLKILDECDALAHIAVDWLRDPGIVTDRTVSAPEADNHQILFALFQQILDLQICRDLPAALLIGSDIRIRNQACGIETAESP